MAVMRYCRYRVEMADRYSGYVSVQSRGTIALPIALRRRYHLDEPGAQVELIEREDGIVELRPALPVDAEQRWFWSERWQAMEREADEDVAGGHVEMFESADALLEALKHAATDG